MSNQIETPLQRWERLCRELTHPAVELTVEEFALLLSAYKRLLAEGHQFDVGTLALMAVLEREATNTDDDSDQDAHDLTLDVDDCDDDMPIVPPARAA
jgi:hypothetical protein